MHKPSGSSLVRKARWPAVSIIRAAVCASLAALAGCTVVTADAETGSVSVYTLMTSRQDVVVERSADGAARWSARESNADAMLAEALLTLSKAAAGVR